VLKQQAAAKTQQLAGSGSKTQLTSSQQRRLGWEDSMPHVMAEVQR
jgi:hypothetical protein